MGHNEVISDIWNFLAYLFPFLASIAFVLFLRKIDKGDQELSEIRERKLDKFTEILDDREIQFEERFEEIEKLASETNSKIENFETLLKNRTDHSGKIVEERLADYSAKFQTRLDQIFDEANHSISLISKEMQLEAKSMREEMQIMHKPFAEREAEFLKEFDSRKNRILDEFQSITKDSERNLEQKVVRIKELTDVLKDKIENLDFQFDSKWEDLNHLFQDKMQSLEKRFSDRFDSVIDETKESRENYMKGFRNELQAFRNQIDDLKGYMQSRQEEILSDSKRSIELFSERILQLSDRFSDIDSRITKQAEFHKTEVGKELRNFEEEFMMFRDKSMEDLEKSLSDMKEKTDRLEDDIIYKIKAVDAHFDDLKTALIENGRELMTEVEKEAFKIGEVIQREIKKSDFKIDQYVKEKSYELDQVNQRYTKEVDDLNRNLNGIQVKGSELLESFKEEFEKGRTVLDNLFHSYEDQFKERSETLFADMTLKLRKTTDEIESEIGRLQKSGAGILEKHETSLAKYTEKLEMDIQSKLEKIKFESEEVLDQIQKTGHNLLEKQEEKIDKFNTTLDDKISRQLTILIDKGQLQLGALEARIANYINDVRGNIEESLKKAKEDSDGQISDFNEHVKMSLKEIENTSTEFLNSSAREFTRSKDEFNKLKDSIRQESSRLEEMKENLYNFLAEENSKIQVQRSRSDQMKEELNKVSDSLFTIQRKTAELQDKITMLTSIDEKIILLQKVYKEVEEKSENLESVNERIGELLRSMEDTEKSESFLRTGIRQLMTEVNLLQDRENEILDNLSQIESKTAFLQSRSSDIKSIESKFEKVEGMMMDLSSKHKQISALQNRLQSLHEESEEMKHSMENLLKEVDDKFDKLSSFASAVDSVSSGKSKGNGRETGGEKMKKKRAIVMELYEAFDWSPETISEKLNMEKSLVETIINSRKNS
ncbi:MAG TPA: hypothetical protein PKV80_06785 [Leptospiraceae bacterium]|nr:hypothetical protein [Leptospiraceae bacterium]